MDNSKHKAEYHPIIDDILHNMDVLKKAMDAMKMMINANIEMIKDLHQRVKKLENQKDLKLN